MMWQIRWLWFCLAFFAVQGSCEAWYYILGDPSQFDPVFQEKYTQHLTLVRCHGISGILCLLAGLSQFAPESLRFRIHRHSGRLYMVTMLMASVTAIPMALMAEGGWTARLSFLLLALLWLLTGVIALKRVLAGDFVSHRRWMVRNYALTYSAISLRLILNFLVEMGWSFTSVYPYVSWTWLIGATVGEWWISCSGEREKK